MKVKSALLVSALALVGCAVNPYRPPSSAPTAALSVMATDIKGSATTRTVGVFVLADDCAPNPNGTHMENVFKWGHPETLSTPSQAITAGRQFHFVAHYADSGMGTDHACLVEARFNPIRDRKYKGVIIINGDVASCDFGLYDVTSGTEELVPFEMPPLVCPIQGQRARPNGQAARTIWKVQVNSY